MAPGRSPPRPTSMRRMRSSRSSPTGCTPSLPEATRLSAVEADDFLVCFEARATPHLAAEWLDRLRRHTDKPVRYLVLSHYHAVRMLGAAAFAAEVIVAHENTKALIAEQGQGGLG